MEEEIHELQDRPDLRRTFTMKNNVARQVAVNFMPSRQMPSNTLRLRRSNSEHNALLDEDLTDAEGGTEQQANIIVREMEQHRQLMEDNPESEELRREALRDLPQGLTMKRHVRAKLSASVSNRSKRKPISVWKRMKYRISFTWKRIKDRIRNFVFSVELWYEAIRKIEGNLGSAVGSYFYFLRWLFAFNLVMVVLMVSFVVVPQAIHNKRTSPNETIESIGAVDFVSGKGFLEDTLAFYGHYHSGNIEGGHYNMTFAYFFTTVSIYLLFFGVLCYRTAYSYRRNFIETGGGMRHVYANKVFSGWDFGIASEQAANLNARSIYNELKELLAEQSRKNIKVPFLTKVWRNTVNIVVMATVLGSIGAVEYGIWRLLSAEAATMRFWEIAISAIVTLVITVCPVLFSAIGKLEYYTPRTALYVTLVRTWLLDIVTLLVLFIFWIRSNTNCWETYFGQETYRLVLLDVFFSLIVIPLFEFFRGFAYKVHPQGPPPVFNIAYNSLTLIYNQAVLLFGMLFAPLLVVAVTFKFLLLFYVKRAVAMYACLPANKVWRAAQTQTVMYMLVTLSQFVTVFATGSLFFKTSSLKCGPYRDAEYVYAVLTEDALRLSTNTVLRSILLFLTRPGVIGFVLVALCVTVYYMRGRAKAQRSMVEILQQMLVIEAKDKEFLLSAISKVSNGEWLYSPRADDAPMPDSHTWKYLHDDRVRKPSNAEFAFDSSRLNHSLLEGSRPRSYVKENRPNSYNRSGSKSYAKDDGDTDSSFSWQGSASHLNGSKNVERGEKDWL